MKQPIQCAKGVNGRRPVNGLGNSRRIFVEGGDTQTIFDAFSETWETRL